jgi:hypothetical protein
MLDAFQELPFVGNLPESMTDEFRKYASFYRETLHSNSINYQFLCFFKIVEGIRNRQGRLINEARARGEKIPPRERHLIPREIQ